LFLLSGCRAKEKITASKEPAVKPVMIDQDFSPRGKNTALEILHAEMISEEVVGIIFSYSGGCLEHSFDLYSSGAMIKTLPPKINFWLVNHQNEDACRQLIQDTLYFNIAAAIPAQEKATGIINGKSEFSFRK
jgi:hypothetical protein